MLDAAVARDERSRPADRDRAGDDEPFTTADGIELPSGLAAIARRMSGGR